MPKLIFRCNYMKGTTTRHKGNYVKYIATRENVEKAISVENLKFKKENYIDYLANRPRVVKIGPHGLFSNEGQEVNLTQVEKEVAEHNGPIWTNVISLTREDAVRLGYDNVFEWQNLIRSKVGLFCENFKIKPENLKWYAAFHNEGYHPHVHLVLYSEKENEGYITKNGIEKIRQNLAHTIFRQDFANICDDQTKARDTLKEKSQKYMQSLIMQIKTGGCNNPQIEKDLLLLNERLKNTKGKKQYGYLKADVKLIVNRIVDELQKDEGVSKLYDEWYLYKYNILKTYTDKMPEKILLSEQKEFKSIKNIVIREAMQLNNQLKIENKNNLTFSTANLFIELCRIFEESINTERISSERSRMRLSRKRRIELLKKGKAINEYEENLYS